MGLVFNVTRMGGSVAYRLQHWRGKWSTILAVYIFRSVPVEKSGELRILRFSKMTENI